MRIDYCSDLHLDNAMSGGPHGWLGSIDISEWKSDGEVLVVAGETAEHIDDTIDFLNSARKHYGAVIATLGNHEVGTPSRNLRDGVHLLDWHDSNHVVIGNVAFVGGCLPPGHMSTSKDSVRSLLSSAINSVGVETVVGVSHY